MPKSRPRLPILISEGSGDGRPRRHERAIRAALGERHDLDILYAPDLTTLLRALGSEIAARTPLVGVGGGDGTIHHAVNLIADAPTTLAPLPFGTGNDFCRSLQLTGMSRALAALAEGSARRVDVLEVQQRRVVTVAGLGVVSRSALQVGRLARPGRRSRHVIRALGSFAYLGAAGARLLFEPKLAHHAILRWQPSAGEAWQTVDGRYYGIFLAARPTLGAGLRLPLDIEADDGRFEIVLVEKRPRVSVALNLPKLRSGAHVPDHLLTVHHGIATEIQWDGGSPIVGDGEDLGTASTIQARVLPHALAVVVGA